MVDFHSCRSLDMNRFLEYLSEILNYLNLFDNNNSLCVKKYFETIERYQDIEKNFIIACTYSNVQEDLHAINYCIAHYEECTSTHTPQKYISEDMIKVNYAMFSDIDYTKRRRVDFQKDLIKNIIDCSNMEYTVDCLSFVYGKGLQYADDGRRRIKALKSKIIKDQLNAFNETEFSQVLPDLAKEKIIDYFLTSSEVKSIKLSKKLANSIFVRSVESLVQTNRMEAMDFSFGY